MPREAVWQALMDPEMLRRCVPGCESLEQTAPNEFRARVALAIGPVRARFDAELSLLDLNPHESYRLRGAGKAGAVGFGQGTAAVVLDAPEPAVTLLNYTAGFQVGGRLAQLGSRLVLGTTRKLADEFFGKLALEMDTGAVATPLPAAAPKPGQPHRAAVVAAILAVLLALGAWWLFARNATV
jgi:carbon monoxide dehydrogenase subunit G